MIYLQHLVVINYEFTINLLNSQFYQCGVKITNRIQSRTIVNILWEQCTDVLHLINVYDINTTVALLYTFMKVLMQ